jgi:hypothetical protein
VSAGDPVQRDQFVSSLTMLVQDARAATGGPGDLSPGGS